MFLDPVTLIVLGIGLVLSLLAAGAVKTTFAHYSKVESRSGFTGAQIARAILQANGIADVQVEPVAGHLTDHYDPAAKTLRLSESVFHSRSVAALGVAAHEVGHAVQDAHSYAPLKFRSAWVPVSGFGTSIGFYLMLAAFFLGGVQGRFPALAWAGLALFGASTVLTFVTLPVEFDASRRAMVTLEQSHVLSADELPGARAVLTAAALTYVAAFVSSLLGLLVWAWRLGLFSQRRED